MGCSKSTTRSCSTCSNTTRPSRLRWTRLWPSFRPIKLSSRLLRLLPSPHRFNPRKTEVRRRSLYQLEKKKRNKKTSKTKASTQKNCKNGKQNINEEHANAVITNNAWKRSKNQAEKNTKKWQNLKKSIKSTFFRNQNRKKNQHTVQEQKKTKNCE